jgi:hypothetical protein
MVNLLLPNYTLTEHPISSTEGEENVQEIDLQTSSCSDVG